MPQSTTKAVRRCKMTMQNDRKPYRIRHEIHVMCASDETGRRHRATAYNYSRDGVYIESDFPYEPGMDVTITMGSYMPISTGDDGLDNYKGKVVWCREIPDSTSYGVGVQFS